MTLRENLISQGCVLVPLLASSKKPRDKDWTNIAYTAADIDGWVNVGINHKLSNTLSLDIDHERLGADLLRHLGVTKKDIPGRYTARPGRWKALFRRPPGLPDCIKNLNLDMDGEITHVLEIRANGHDVLPGSIHPDTKEEYAFLNGGLTELPELPAPLAELVLNWTERMPAIVKEVYGLDWKVQDKDKTGEELLGNRQAIVAHFNQGHLVEEILVANGYVECPNGRYLYPGSQSGTPGVIVYGDVVQSYHESGDPLNDGRQHDAFDCMRILEKGGDWQAALDAVGISVDEIAAGDFEPVERERESETVGFTTWDQAHTFTPPNELIQGVLTYPSSAMFVAGYNVGKSALALDMAVSVATGNAWCGRQVEQGGVLYMAVEGENSIKGRTLAYPEVSGVPFYIMGAQQVDLSTPEGRSRTGRVLLTGCEGLEIKLVIVDTLAEAAPAIDENSLEFAQTAKWAKKIAAALDACVLIIHHRAKHSTGSRGHTSVPGAMDTILEIARDDETGVCTGEWTKQRDLATRGQEITYAIRSFETGLRNNFGDMITVPRVDFNVEQDQEEEPDPVELDKQRRYRILYLYQNGRPTMADLKTDLGVGQETIAPLRDELVQDGLLNHISARRWEVTQAGSDWLQARLDLRF